MTLPWLKVLPGGSPRPRRQIWAVGGGKGGIGKSLLAASVGWELARMGRQVVLIDADLGGANLHTRLGLPTPPRTLGDFLQGRCSSLEGVVTATPTLGLRLISGAADLLSAPSIDQAQKTRLLGEIRALDVDVVLIDLGAGTSSNTLDFFLLSDVSILMVVPEPASIHNAYRFIKTALYRRLHAAARPGRVRALVEAALDPKGPLGIRTPADLIARVGAESLEAAAALRREVAAFQPCFVVTRSGTRPTSRSATSSWPPACDTSACGRATPDSSTTTTRSGRRFAAAACSCRKPPSRARRRRSAG